MRPENPEQVTPDGHRIIVPAQFVPGWFSRSDGKHVVRMVPLLWKRETALPDGHQLEAWLLWSESDPSGDWHIDPQAVLDAAQPSPNAYPLRTLIHPATFALSDRKHRLNCAGLFRYLVEKGGSKLWVTDEGSTLGVMTDFAYHTSYGRLRL